MTILNSIWRELQNEPQLDYATAMNSSRIHHFFVTETRNRKPNNRGIHNRNRNFKNRARILISDKNLNHNKNSDFKIVLYRNPSCRRTSDRKIRCSIYFWTMFCRDNNIMEKMHHKDYKSLIYHKDSIHSWLGFVFLRLFIFKYHLIRKCVGILNFNSSIAIKQIPTYLSRYIYKS